jgi:predicted ATPase
VAVALLDVGYRAEDEARRYDDNELPEVERARAVDVREGEELVDGLFVWRVESGERSREA